jgi:hypothetical protein
MGGSTPLIEGIAIAALDIVHCIICALPRCRRESTRDTESKAQSLGLGTADCPSGLSQSLITPASEIRRTAAPCGQLAFCSASMCSQQQQQ